MTAISGAIGVGLIGAGVIGPVGALMGMLVGGLVGHLIHRHAASEVS